MLKLENAYMKFPKLISFVYVSFGLFIRNTQPSNSKEFKYPISVALAHLKNRFSRYLGCFRSVGAYNKIGSAEWIHLQISGFQWSQWQRLFQTFYLYKICILYCTPEWMWSPPLPNQKKKLCWWRFLFEKNLEPSQSWKNWPSQTLCSRTPLGGATASDSTKHTIVPKWGIPMVRE